MNSLEDIQNWMQTALVSRGDLDEKLRLAYESSGLKIEELIEMKRGVSLYERFDIYASGYVLRLLECLRADFPKLLEFMGDSLFDTFAKAYIITIPSKSWSLYHLGENFSKFLDETRPNNNPLFKLPSELAKIERMEVEALQNRGVENTLQKEHLNILGSLDKNLKIKRVECAKVLELEFDLYDFYFHIKPLQNSPILEEKKSYLCITRVNYIVKVKRLEYWEYIFLKECKDEILLDDAIFRCSKITKIPQTTLKAKLLFLLDFFITNVYIKVV